MKSWLVRCAVLVTLAGGACAQDPVLAARQARAWGAGARMLGAAAPGRGDEVIDVADGSIVGQSRRIFTGMVGTPAISANGKVAVFNVLDEQGRNDIHAVEDGQVTRITSDGEPKFRPRVSADGSVIVWAQKMVSQNRDDWDPMMWKGGQVTNLMEDKHHALYMDVSPDGQKVVFDRDEDGSGGYWDIWVWENGQLTQLTQGGGDQGFPILSGDAQTVLWLDYSQGPDAHTGWMMRWRGGEVARVLPDEERAQLQPAISHDGRTVIYSLAVGEFHCTIHRVTEGAAPEVLVDDPGLNQSVAANADCTIFAYNRVAEVGSHWDVLFSEGGTLHPVVTAEGSQISPDVDASGTRMVWMDSFTDGDGIHQIYRFSWQHQE